MKRDKLRLFLTKGPLNTSRTATNGYCLKFPVGFREGNTVTDAWDFFSRQAQISKLLTDKKCLALVEFFDASFTNHSFLVRMAPLKAGSARHHRWSVCRGHGAASGAHKWQAESDRRGRHISVARWAREERWFLEEPPSGLRGGEEKRRKEMSWDEICGALDKIESESEIESESNHRCAAR